MRGQQVTLIVPAVKTRRMEYGIYVQYGCHFVAPEGWLNFDASPTLRFERLPLIGKLCAKNTQRFPDAVRFGDIVKGLPLPEGSCRGIYASHVLEHLSLRDCHTAIQNTHRLLAPAGIFRLVVPDLERAAREYLRLLEQGFSSANSAFLQATRLGYESRPRSLKDFLRWWVGHSMHLWMWDFPSLLAALRQHGFRHIRRCEFGDCRDPMFESVERKARFENAVAVEAVK